MQKSRQAKKIVDFSGMEQGKKESCSTLPGGQVSPQRNAVERV